MDKNKELSGLISIASYRGFFKLSINSFLFGSYRAGPIN
jgi:hypothetical protein